MGCLLLGCWGLAHEMFDAADIISRAYDCRGMSSRVLQWLWFVVETIGCLSVVVWLVATILPPSVQLAYRHATRPLPEVMSMLGGRRLLQTPPKSFGSGTSSSRSCRGERAYEDR